MESNALSDVQYEETKTTSSKQSKISYTRGHLLSLSCLEVCKRLPKDFDKSLLSELETVSHVMQERFRTPGSLPVQGSRHNNDYGSSPPSKGEMGNFSRGSHRWDSRSGGRSDADSQSDRDADSGRRYGNQYRRPWQNSEHDGLLGSGSFQRPSRHGSSASVPGFGANDQDQLSRKNDPYHPPRPYKAVPHIRRETNDSYNDETFGSDECTSEDRVEEERKRRAEFEMIRKEQQKELQEKLKSKSVDKLKDDPLSELAASSNDRDAKLEKGLDMPLMEQVEQDDYCKLSVSSQSEPSRPVVPPGFVNTAVGKASVPKSFRLSDPVQVEMPELGDGNQDEKSALKLSLVDNHSDNTSILDNQGKRVADLSLAFGSIQASLPDDQLFNISNNVNTRLLENHIDTGIHPRNVTHDNIMVEADSTPTSQRIFGGTLSINGDNVSNNFKSTKTDDFGSRKSFHSSKFAQWFPEEEKKQPQNVSSNKSNDLLSLIFSERIGTAAPETSSMPKMLPLKSNLENFFPTPNSPDATPENLHNKKKPETSSAILTCEDLERSMLSEIGESSSSSQSPGKIYVPRDVETEKPISDNVNSGSKLLSLLGKGISPNSTMGSPIFKLEKPTPEAYQKSEIGKNTEIQGSHAKDAYAGNLNRSGTDLTLETFFGKDFMKELKSLDAPVSAQANSATIVSIGVSDHNVSISEGGSRKFNNDDGISRLGGRHEMNLENVGVNCVSFDSSHKEVESSLNVPTDLWLPEEDSLISVNDPANARSSMFKANLGVTNVEMERSSSNTSVNIAEKLAAFGASMKDDSLTVPGHDSLFFPPTSMVNSEYPYPNTHAFSSPQFDPTLVNHGRPMFHPLDSHTPYIDPQLNFLMQKGIIHRDDLNHHQFPPNPNHSPYLQPNSGIPAFDHHSSFPTVHQMSMSTNLPPPHLLHGFLGGAPPRLRDSINSPGYTQERNPIEGLSYGQLQPNHGGLGMHLRGPEQGVIDNGPPEAFHRLVEMELRRSNAKPMHPSFLADGGHTRPMFGHDLDTGFRYR